MEKVKGPVGFEIRLTGHSMGLVYNGDENWTLIDHDRCIKGDINSIAKKIYKRWTKREDCFSYGDENSTVFGRIKRFIFSFFEKREKLMVFEFVAYAKPKGKKVIEECKKIMEKAKVLNVNANQIPERLKSRNMLLGAAQIGDINAVRELLDHEKCDTDTINAKGSLGYTVLEWAGRFGHTEVVKVILDHEKCDADVINAKGSSGYTALEWAVRLGHAEVVKALLDNDKCDADVINTRDRIGYTALMWAVNNSHTEVVKVVLNHYNGEGKPIIDINAKYDNEETLLMIAVIHAHTEVVKVILNHCNRKGKPITNIKDSNNGGETVMIMAARRGDAEIVKAILDHPGVNADVINARDRYGQTALMTAANSGKTDVVLALLDHKDGDSYAVSNKEAKEAANLVEQTNPGLEKMIGDHISKRETEVYSPGRRRHRDQERLDRHRYKEKLGESQKELERKVTDFNLLKRGMAIALGAIAVAATVYNKFGTGL